MLHRGTAEFATADAAEVLGAHAATGGERVEFPTGREFAHDRLPELADAGADEPWAGAAPRETVHEAYPMVDLSRVAVA